MCLCLIKKRFSVNLFYWKLLLSVEKVDKKNVATTVSISANEKKPSKLKGDLFFHP